MKWKRRNWPRQSVIWYRTQGYNEPVILLTDMVAENFDLALQIRNRFVRRWDCETSIEFLKSRMGLERFVVRRYRSMQRLIFLSGLAMGFLSYLQSRCRCIRRQINDKLRYCREPESFWFYRLLIALRDAFSIRASMSLSAWCKAPPWMTWGRRHFTIFGVLSGAVVRTKYVGRPPEGWDALLLWSQTAKISPCFVHDLYDRTTTYSKHSPYSRNAPKNGPSWVSFLLTFSLKRLQLY